MEDNEAIDLKKQPITERHLVNRRDALIRWHVFLVLVGSILGVVVLCLIEIIFPAVLGSVAALMLVFGISPATAIFVGRWVTREWASREPM